MNRSDEFRSAVVELEKRKSFMLNAPLARLRAMWIIWKEGTHIWHSLWPVCDETVRSPEGSISQCDELSCGVLVQFRKAVRSAHSCLTVKREG